MSGARVLLVEDEGDIRDLITRTLRRDDLVLEAVESGEAALDHLAEHQVDLLILDIVLPKMSGWQVLDALRAEPRLVELPVLVVSVLDPSGRPPDPHVTYLAKPFRPAELAPLVRSLLAPPTEGRP